MNGYNLPSNPKRSELDNAMDDLWRKSAPNFLYLLCDMFEKGIHTDVTIKVKLGNRDREIQCHSLILSAHSPVFSTMLSERWGSGDNSDADRRLITVTEDDFDHFSFFAKMMYWDWNEDNFESYDIPTEVTPELAVGVLSLAHKYLATHIIRHAEHLIFCFLSKKLAADTVKLYLLLKSLSICGDGQIARKTLRTVENCVLADGEQIFSSDAILQLNQAELTAFIKRFDIKCPEKIIYSGCLKWAQEQCKIKNLTTTGENIRSVLQNTLECIRFPLLDKLTIVNEVLPANILPQEDVNELLIYIVKRDCPELKDNPTKFCIDNRLEPQTLIIRRLDSFKVSKDNLADISSPHGFTMSLSTKMSLCGMDFFCGKNVPGKYNFCLEVNGTKKTVVGEEERNRDRSGPTVAYIAIQPSIEIPENVSVDVKFTVTGDTDTNIVSAEMVDETRKEISYWEDKAVFMTFKLSPNVSNGLMQVPRLYFESPKAITQNHGLTWDTSLWTVIDD